MKCESDLNCYFRLDSIQPFLCMSAKTTSWTDKTDRYGQMPHNGKIKNQLYKTKGLLARQMIYKTRTKVDRH